MATAKRIEGVPVPVLPPDTIELTLTLEEAATLRDVCNYIGGDPTKSRRRYFNGIATALYSASVFFQTVHDLEKNCDGLWFKNTEEK